MYGISNHSINWNTVEEAAEKCKSIDELDQLWKDVDRLCWGRDEIDKIDKIEEKHRKRLEDSGHPPT